ncbi:MAG: DNA mismatch repair endonuclease MutL [Armatimonadetes bacterium]|jgi:DNA mismatch repair protein MutL|nr:DNA mismatch repair endonuclease MutL [Armatimonadota bacterium]
MPAPFATDMPVTEQQPRIVVLDTFTASRIAAGEVVERPASALKELVENAIDAGATRIDVEWEESGVRLLRVSDNGGGMTGEEAALALQRHATSKIRSADDLENLSTLGFRGEALPSIASVSHLRLLTGNGESATEVRVNGGEIEGIRPAVRERGTDVWIHNLFFNQPARARFLKSATTENAQNMDVVTRLAMAHPKIAFRVRVDGREALRTSGCGDYAETVAEALGANVARDLVPVRCETENIVVHGYVSRPTLTRPTRAGQHFWVNRHPVQNRVLLHGFDSGYRAILPTDRHPYVVLFVEMPPGTVDVNVHPRKADVRFQREQTVHSAVYHAVREGLLAADLRPELDPEPLLPAPGFGEIHPLLPMNHGPVTFLPPPSTQPAPTPAAYDPEDPFAEPPPAVPQPETPQATQPATGMRTTFRVLGQIQNTFLVVEGDKGLMLVDQHVAHERVLYEELARQMSSSAPDSQHLLLPMSVQLEPSEMAVWKTNRAGLESAGFEIEEFGTDSVLIRAVPALLASRFTERSFKDFLSGMVEGGPVGSSDDLREHILSTASCKAAVKAGDVLEPEEMSGLMEALFRTTNPYLCPHGRPIILHLTVDELLKKFQRA